MTSVKPFWKNEQNRKNFFEMLSRKVNVKEMSDWYNITTETIHRYGGGGLLSLFYRDSLSFALKSIYPEHEWNPWLFKRTATGFWNSLQNQRVFFDWLGIQLGFKSLDNWYSLTKEKIIKHGGARLLLLYNNSPSAAVSAIYPEICWMEWKFNKVPEGFWDSEANTKRFVLWLEKELEIHSLNDWYRISLQQIEKVGTTTPFVNRGFLKTLESVYPSHSWDENKLLKKQGTSKAAQRTLFVRLQQIFPKEEVLEEYFHEDLRFLSTGSQMSLDVFVPSLNLAFEYQGQQHYKDIFALSSNHFQYLERDQEKRLVCRDKGITLIEIPYWWDFQAASLKVTIYNYRPDVISEPGDGVPIPKDPPQTFVQSNTTVLKVENTTLEKEALAKYRNSLDMLGSRLGVKAFQDWYKVSLMDVRKQRGRATLRKFGNSLKLALESCYPEQNWAFWRFKSEKVVYSSLDSLNKFFQWLAKECKIHQMEDWYKVNRQTIYKHEGRKFLKPYGDSLFKALKTLYPNHEWMFWRFGHVPREDWQDNQKIRTFIMWLSKELNLRSMEEWHKISKEHILHNGGHGLIQFYNNSVFEILQHNFSEYIWNPLSFEESLGYEIMFMNWLGKKLSIKMLADWYHVSRLDFVKHGGINVLDQYRSLYELLKRVYPNHPWVPWEFSKVPKGFWEDKENQLFLLNWLTKKFKVVNLDDWYRISPSSIMKLKSVPQTPFKSVGLSEILLSAYPHHDWDKEKLFSRAGSSRSSQRVMALAVAELFPDTDIHEEYTLDDLRFKSGHPMQLDLFLPAKNLAFEYQGEQHFQDVFAIGPQWHYLQRDSEKRFACQVKGITLIEVPFWWDFDPQSLKATVLEKRPDLVMN